MSGRMQFIQPGKTATSSNQEVLFEIERFLQALDSYPDRFAREPQISFEQHLCSVVAAGQTAPHSAD